MKTINYYVNEKLKLNSQSRLKSKNDWISLCHLLYDKISEWHQEYSKNQKLLHSFIFWLKSDIDSMTVSENSGYDIYQNIVNELLNTNRISQEEYDNFLQSKEIDKITEFCVNMIINIVENTDNNMDSFKDIMKDSFSSLPKNLIQ